MRLYFIMMMKSFKNVAKTIFKKMVCSKQNQEWQERQSVPKTRHGRTSTATSSTTTTTTTRDAQSHKHAPSQFSFLEANSNNSRAESINGCFSFGGRETQVFLGVKWFSTFWLSTSVVAIIVIVLPRANHYDYDHTHTTKQKKKKQGNTSTFEEEFLRDSR